MPQDIAIHRSRSDYDCEAFGKLFVSVWSACVSLSMLHVYSVYIHTHRHTCKVIFCFEAVVCLVVQF